MIMIISNQINKQTNKQKIRLTNQKQKQTKVIALNTGKVSAFITIV